MTMNELLIWAGSLAAGLVLGAVFFGGLWWTIRKGMASPAPALWFLGSFVLRMGVVVAGFYFVAGPHWQRLVSCLLGFVLARLLVTRLTRAASPQTDPLKPEATHAS